MKAIIDASGYRFIVSGATIRVTNTWSSNIDSKELHKAGIATILPKVQIALGGQMEAFLTALDLSRLPLAINMTMEKNGYEVYDVIRLETGIIPRRTIASISVYRGIIVGVTYNKKLIHDKEFRRHVSLSAMHQLTLCNKDDPNKLYKASLCISTLTSIDRDRLIVSQTSKTIKVKIRPNKSTSESKWRLERKIPLYYVFVLDNAGRYMLTQMIYEFNEMMQEIDNHLDNNVDNT